MPELQVINEKSPVELGVADEMISGLRGRLTGLDATSKAGYEQVKAGISEVRTLRVGVEKARKELKKSAIDWGRKVDSEAKRVTAMLLEIEEPLKVSKAEVDDAEEIERKAREAEELRKFQESERIAKEELEAARRAENERIAAEQAKEKEALEQERKKLQDERKAQEEKLAAERKEIEAERAKIEAEKREKEELLRKDREEKERKEREEVEAARVKKEAEAEAKRAEAEEKESARIQQERKPDKIKLAEFANAIEKFASDSEDDSLKTVWARQLENRILQGVDNLATQLRQELEEVK